MGRLRNRVPPFPSTIFLLFLALSSVFNPTLFVNATQQPIKTIVVLVLENRSFDHMIGWMKNSINPKINGVTGKECNSVSTNSTAQETESICYTNDAEYVDPDPGHSFEDVEKQVFGSGSIPSMSGFVEQALSLSQNLSQTVMKGFKPENVPIYATLVGEFAVFDRWFSSIPGPTQPNRLFVYSATSHGSTSHVKKQLATGYPQQTIFDSLHDSGLDFGIYFQTIPTTLFYRNLRKLKYILKFHEFDLKFKKDARNGKLPNLTVIEPRYFDLKGIPANDDHPSHDVANGQKLVKEVYETLRSSPQWNESLLLITYDEHGGFYDHVQTSYVNIAYQVFKKIPRKNVVVWNAMLSALAMHGRGRVALEMFPEMVQEVKPDDITFTAVLSACSHSGLVDQGRHYFYNLESVYGITPSMEHYSCMVDLLGRAGQLEEAEKLIRRMPIHPNEVVLGSLLGSCSVHNKLQLGERLMCELVEMYPLNVEYHVLLSNMYALAGKHDKANSLRKILKDRGLRKVPGISFIHVRGQVHQFCAGDKSHPQTREIYFMLDEMIRKLKLAGYNPNTSSQIFSCSRNGEGNEDEHEEKELALFSHSEKLAVCFGLISTRAGMPLYIFKNLRICQDCHSALKIISTIYSREIVIRDRNRFHCFKQGVCSCSDYW